MQGENSSCIDAYAYALSMALVILTAPSSSTYHRTTRSAVAIARVQSVRQDSNTSNVCMLPLLTRLRQQSTKLRVSVVLLLAVALIELLKTGNWTDSNKALQILLGLDLNNITFDSHTCQIPVLDPWDLSIQSYVSQPLPLRCKALQVNLLVINNGKWYIDHKVLTSVGGDAVTCLYRCILKTELDVEPAFGKWKTLRHGSEPSCDLVHTRCSRGLFRMVVYEKMHAHVVPNRDKMELFKNTVSNVPPNVLIVGLDSMSRSNWIRQMPRTYEYLVHNLSAVDVRQMNKAGLNTYPITMAMLAGLVVNPYTPAAERGPHDLKPMICFNYSRKGYATMYAADWPKLDALNYDWSGAGFRSAKPFDHHMRPFWLAMWPSMLHRRSTSLCYDDVPKHVLTLNYAMDMFRAYPRVPKFALVWNSEVSHSYLNQAGMADADHLRFLKNLQPFLNNTFLFVLSDHGQRVDVVRKTAVGRLEDRLPFFSMVVPPWFKKKHTDLMHNLAINANARLTSTFDMHATLAEILHESYQQTKAARAVRGLSLFRPIPATRDCVDAWIPDDDCACAQTVTVNVFNPLIQSAASATVEHMNALAQSLTTQCAVLTLANVTWAQLLLPHHGVQKRNVGNSVDVLLTIVTAPGHGVFEAKVHYTIAGAKPDIRNLDRVDRYGNQSYCAEHIISIKHICFCKNLQQ